MKGLGRGLDALLAKDEEAGAGDTLKTLKLDELQPGKYQPRTRMDQASMEELARSLKSQGVMQPILARTLAKGRYEIIAGERRWRAAKIAGLREVPVVIREVPDSAALTMALIENIQREDLNPLEQATGIHRLINEFKMTHQEAAEAVGRSRAATTNLLRLLNLPQSVQALVYDGKIDMGHARALLALEGRRQEDLAKRVAERGLSVRQTEKAVQDILNPKPKKSSRLRTNRDILRLEEELAEKFGTKVEIKPGKKGAGKLLISYVSHEHLDDLLSKFKG
ncbi:MAG: chromosome partitioning protein ParB [Betaproteobacteria bacterium RIFCSPLOWO2_12_FULL_64_23]|nr:MAG: chromosome partitioning protein ParB [Betaproteobacteria bacterium RIFCSPLOWO2_12_FULL_64_23]